MQTGRLMLNPPALRAQAPHNHPYPHNCQGYNIFAQPAQPSPETHNIWRDSSLRYIGYADEAGEILANYIGPKAVRASYYASAAYGLVDILSTAKKTFKNHNHRSRGHRFKRTLEEIVDGTLFHTAATVFIPATLIRYVRMGVEKLQSSGKLPVKLQQFKHLPAVVAFAALPFIAHPVDQLTDWFLDKTYRRMIGVIHPTKPTIESQLHTQRLRADIPQVKEPSVFKRLF